MPGPRPRKGPQARGQGVAAAKQMGLFMEFGPEDMLLGIDEAEDDEDLEAELLALTGEAQTTGKKPAPKGQAPLPMAHIEKLAADCMRDVEEEEEEEGLEEDAELLVCLPGWYPRALRQAWAWWRRGQWREAGGALLFSDSECLPLLAVQWVACL